MKDLDTSSCNHVSLHILPHVTPHVPIHVLLHVSVLPCVSGTQSQNPPSNKLLVKSNQLQLSISESKQILNFHLTSLSHDKHFLHVGHNYILPDHNKELVTLIKNMYNMSHNDMITNRPQLRETFIIQL